MTERICMEASVGIDEVEKSDLGIVLLRHFTLYPRMGVGDFVKLVYQNEFGGGHMVLDEASSLVRLADEWNGPCGQGPSESLTEDIGNGIMRLNLRPAKVSGLLPETVNRIFVLSANSVKGSTDGFKAKLNILRRLCDDVNLPFGLEGLEDYLAGYEKRGYPPTSHSAAYREAYSPSYRVIRKQYGDLLDLLAEADRAFCAGTELFAITTIELNQRPKDVNLNLLAEIYGSDRISIGPTGSIEISSGRTGIR